MTKVASIKAKHDEVFADLQSYLGLPEADLKVASSKEEEYTSLKVELDAALALESRVSSYQEDIKTKSAVRPVAPRLDPTSLSRPSFKSLGRRLIESDAYKSFRVGSPMQNQGAIFGDFDARSLKTTLTQASLTNYDYLPTIATLGTQRPVVADLIASGETTGSVVRMPVETSFVNLAAATLEGALKPEAVFALSETDFPVRKIAVVGRISDEIFADHPAVMSYVDNRLTYGVSIAEEFELIGGNGTAPHLTGFLNTPGIQTVVKGTGQTDADAVMNAMTNIRAIGYDEPSGMVVHPVDWQALKLAKDTAGQYYGGGPFAAASYGNSIPQAPKYWGLDVVITTSISQGTILIGAFRTQSQIFRRQGLTVELCNSDGQDFSFNRVAIRVEERFALVVYRPKSFCVITGVV